MLVDQKGFTSIFDFGDGAFEVEGFREDDLEDLYRRVSIRIVGVLGKILYLLHVDTVACAAEDQTCPHRFGEAPSLEALGISIR